MNSDFIKELGYKALDSRMKRISDRISYSVKKLYKELDYEIEPHWYLVFKLLSEKKELSIIEIAEQLGYSHPSLVITVKKMNANGFLIVKKDKKDKRKQLVSLSQKANDQLPEFEKLWNSCEATILNVLEEDLSILKHLDRIDDAMEQSSFYYRLKSEYLKTNPEN